MRILKNSSGGDMQVSECWGVEGGVKNIENVGSRV